MDEFIKILVEKHIIQDESKDVAKSKFKTIIDTMNDVEDEDDNWRRSYFQTLTLGAFDNELEFHALHHLIYETLKYFDEHMVERSPKFTARWCLKESEKISQEYLNGKSNKFTNREKTNIMLSSMKCKCEVQCTEYVYAKDGIKIFGYDTYLCENCGMVISIDY